MHAGGAGPPPHTHEITFCKKKRKYVPDELYQRIEKTVDWLKVINSYQQKKLSIVINRKSHW